MKQSIKLISHVCMVLIIILVSLSTPPRPAAAVGESVAVPANRVILSSSTNVALGSSFTLTGFTSALVLATVDFGSAAARFSVVTTTGLTRLAGSSAWTNQARIDMVGSVANVQAALRSMTMTTTTPETVALNVSVTAYKGMSRKKQRDSTCQNGWRWVPLVRKLITTL